MIEIADRIKQSLASYNRHTIPGSDGVPAGVLIPLFKKDGAVYVLLTKRTQTVQSHKGQISFPGGASEAEDKDICNTALRETYEEVGIDPKDVDLLGRLDDVMAISNHAVTPVVGIIPYPYDFKVSTDEIDELIEVPLEFFMDQGNCRIERRMYQGREVSVYFYQYGRHTVWGLTAYIIRDFLEVCYGIPR